MINKFIISTFSFNPAIGGLTVLHKLCDMLNKHGYEAYLAHADWFGIGHAKPNTPFKVSPRYNTPMITDEMLSNINDYIVIYPESWYGNYLRAPNVVRWILGPPERDKVVTWDDGDMWVWYSPMYSSTGLNYNGYFKDVDNILFLQEFYRDIFRKTNQSVRDITSWTLRKSTGRISPSEYIHEKDSVFISYEDAGNMEWLSDVFNRSNTFYSYDTYTFLNVQALMCGADSIVVPASNLSHEDFINHGIYNKYIAYGTNDLARARSERDSFDDCLFTQEMESINQLHLFVEKCNDYFKLKG